MKMETLKVKLKWIGSISSTMEVIRNRVEEIGTNRNTGDEKDIVIFILLYLLYQKVEKSKTLSQSLIEITYKCW